MKRGTFITATALLLLCPGCLERPQPQRVPTPEPQRIKYATTEEPEKTSNSCVLTFILIAAAVGSVMFIMGTATGSSGMQQVIRQQNERRNRYERRKRSRRPRAIQQKKAHTNGQTQNNGHNKERRDNPRKASA